MTEKRVYPQIIPRRNIGNVFLGNFRSHFAWKGIEFQDYRQYSYWDSARHIDWQVSSRCDTTLVRRYHEDRDIELYCFCDIRESLHYGRWEKAKIIEELCCFFLEMSWILWEKIGALIQNAHGNRYIAVKKASQNRALFHRISAGRGRSISEKIDFSPLLNKNIKKSIVFCMSDSFELDEISLQAAALKHDIIYIHISCYFEDTLEWDSLHQVQTNTKQYCIDLSDTEKKRKYQDLRKKQKDLFAQKLHGFWIQTLFVHEKTNIASAFYSLMQERKYR